MVEDDAENEEEEEDGQGDKSYIGTVSCYLRVL
jgi:hypothetical protein